MAFYTIHEEVTFEVEATSPREALEIYLNAVDQNVFCTGVTERYITDENGEERDNEDEES